MGAFVVADQCSQSMSEHKHAGRTASARVIVACSDRPLEGTIMNGKRGRTTPVVAKFRCVDQRSVLSMLQPLSSLYSHDREGGGKTVGGTETSQSHFAFCWRNIYTDDYD